MKTDVIINRDALCALQELPSESVHCCVTSPPYFALRDYGLDAQIGQEDTPEQYIDRLTSVFRELYRVLRKDGTLWLNIADTYCGTGNKGGYADPKKTKGTHRTADCKEQPRYRLQTKGLNRYSLALGVFPTGTGVVSTERYYMAKTKSYAGKLQRPPDPLL